MIDKIQRCVLSFIIIGLLIMLWLCNYLLASLNRLESNTAEIIKPIYIPIEHEEKVEPKKIVVIEKVNEDIIEETEEEILEEVKLLEVMLTAKLGRVQGPVENETWYNLPMDLVIQNMRNKGYSELDYPYWIRDDGVKMFGDYIIVAADLNEYPRGTIVETSLGQGIVCDKCEHGEEFDIAVDWVK